MSAGSRAAAYRLLRLSPDVTCHVQITKAFRTRSKELHPDVNKSSNAHAEFLALASAYEQAKKLATQSRYGPRH